jgi:hypothetical protein
VLDKLIEPRIALTFAVRLDPHGARSHVLDGNIGWRPPSLDLNFDTSPLALLTQRAK